MVIGSLLEKAGIQCAQSRRVHGSHPLYKCLFPFLKLVLRVVQRVGDCPYRLGLLAPPSEHPMRKMGVFREPIDGACLLG